MRTGKYLTTPERLRTHYITSSISLFGEKYIGGMDESRSYTCHNYEKETKQLVSKVNEKNK